MIKILRIFIFVSSLFLTINTVKGENPWQLKSPLKKQDTINCPSYTSGEGSQWKTYIHPRLSFSIDYPPELQAIEGKPYEETVPTQEYEWHFPNSNASVYLGLYDRPEKESLIQCAEAIGGVVKEITIRGSIPAISREALYGEVYEREILIDAQKQGFIIALLFSARVPKSSDQRTMNDIKKDLHVELEVFEQMVKSFHFGAKSHEEPKQ